MKLKIGDANQIAPGGGLAAHEGPKMGHLIKEHVGKSDKGLLRRLKKRPDLPSASSFKSRAIAERVVNRVLSDPVNQRKIKNWQNSSNVNDLVLKYHGDGKIIGRWVKNGSDLVHNVTKARIVLRKTKNGLGYFVLTGYPIR